MSEGSGLRTFRRNSRTAFLILWSLGCGGRPSNPGAEVISHPPVEVNIDAFEDVEVTLNGVDAFNLIPELTTGDKVAVRARIVRNDRTIIPSIATLLVRLLPEGTPEERWESFKVEDEYIGVIDVLSGQSTFEPVIRERPGRFDLRCYALYMVATEEKPAFYLIGKGKAEVTAGRKEPTVVGTRSAICGNGCK